MTTIILEEQGKPRFESKTVTFQATLASKQEPLSTRVEEDRDLPFDLVRS